jgi:hypothetical protein
MEKKEKKNENENEKTIEGAEEGARPGGVVEGVGSKVVVHEGNTTLELSIDRKTR